MDRRVLKNDDALAEYLKSISSELLKIAYSYIQDDATVDDVISETIYRVYKYRKKVRKPEYLKTWIIRILINECKTELMKHKPVYELEEDRIAVSEPEDFTFVYEYINQLKSPQREIVTLKTLNDYTFAMIARVLGLKENTVKTDYYRALDILRKEMHDLYE
ncbi:hypothetical protein AOC36_11150 [Erysipelothrix larvae]|uniref:RNA polymerase subunit sigma-24 n=1 Tax=Erysipelothrix larvae TaxID=1514105 RepID=A0A0X8H1T4_9FIRM|nr:sigma-70 family RNA polymerase sigma factor [Erysipelothrix larvae]AMC94507.1 hypothetical protein AOC36_11150 [Erysipelothrix larvae]